MNKQLFVNNASSQLSGTLPQGGVTLVCASNQGNRFPTPSNGDYFYLTIFTKDVYANEQEIEIVKVTARASDVMTVVRDVENITGQSGGFAYNGSTTTVYLEMRWTAGCVDNLVQKPELGTAAALDIASNATVARTWTLPDKSGTVAMLDDVVGEETTATIKAKLGITTLSGSNTGDDTTATIKAKLGISTLSGANTGDQTLESLGAQAALVSGTNIKTVNGNSLLGSENIVVSAVMPLVLVAGTSQATNSGNLYVLRNAALSTATLPASPSDGDVVGVLPDNGRIDNVIARNGKQINGLAEDLTIDNASASVLLRYVDATSQWRII